MTFCKNCQEYTDCDVRNGLCPICDTDNCDSEMDESYAMELIDDIN